jgi:hypothetical protein
MRTMSKAGVDATEGVGSAALAWALGLAAGATAAGADALGVAATTLGVATGALATGAGDWARWGRTTNQ